MTSVALFGAGGKMGQRLSQNMVGSIYEVRHVEVSEAGQARVKANFGADCWSPDDAIKAADIVVLAVPDTAIGKVASTLVPKLTAGTMVMILDAAAAYAGHMPERDDLTYFVSVTCRKCRLRNPWWLGITQGLGVQFDQDKSPELAAPAFDPTKTDSKRGPVQRSWRKYESEF